MDLSYCVMCLATDVKMFHMNPSQVRIYKELISLHEELSSKYMHACYECVYSLHKCGKFKAKCYNAYKILCSLGPGPFEVNKENVKTIDRKHNKLESELKVSTITFNCYQPIQENECNDLDNRFYVEKVEPESVLIRIQKQCNVNIFHSQEDLQSPTTDPINFDSNLSNESFLSNVEIKADIKSAQDIDDDNCSLEVLRFNINSNKHSVYIVSSKDGYDLETAQVTNNESDTVPLIKLELEAVDSNRDSDSVISSKCPIKVDINNIISEIKKGKHETINKNNIYSKQSKKRKSVNNNLTKTMKFANGELDKRNNKKGSHTNGKKSMKVTDKSGKDSRFTINSSIFKEHMTIVQLTPEDAMNELLLRKESRNYKMSSYKCDLCYRGFISEVTYQTHMKKHSLDYGTLKCDTCQLSFTESRRLTNHRIVCHTRKFICKICPYVCFGANQARAHIRSHKGKKYTCKECREIFRFPNSLSTHMRLRHSEELVCEFCGSTFASLKGLDCHKHLLHRKDKNEHLGPKCDECDVHFATELAWKRHRVLCSRHGVSDGCGVCGESFADARSLRTHLREHGPLPTTWNSRLRTKPPAASAAACAAPQTCSYCDQELRNKKEYKIHMASEHPRMTAPPGGFPSAPPVKWVCEVCGKMFKHHSLFASHQRKHTGEKPFSCPECGKRFKRADAVRAHRPLHTKQYAFKCHLCDKAYGDRGKLNRHVKGHLGIRPYKCPYCDKSFLYQCVANAHVKYVHCKEPYPKRDRSKRTVKAKMK